MIYDIGTDIVSVKRLENVIENSPSFLTKVYTNDELKLAKNFKNPKYFYATRFAAKEAILKAVGVNYEFNEIEILKAPDGKPLPHIINHDDIKIKLSLSYDGDYAVAFCIILS
ncbi:MAG: holo-ACP synthase [Bacilli bacterium]|nr:holo-ACP synthase [Bacilli bacterium]